MIPPSHIPPALTDIYQGFAAASYPLVCRCRPDGVTPDTPNTAIADQQHAALISPQDRIRRHICMRTESPVTLQFRATADVLPHVSGEDALQQIEVHQA